MPGFLLAECRAFVDGFIRELLPWPLPLRRQGEAGRGCPRFALILKAPLPSPPLPSQGRERELAAEAAPTRTFLRIAMVKLPIPTFIISCSRLRACPRPDAAHWRARGRG